MRQISKVVVIIPPIFHETTQKLLRIDIGEGDSVGDVLLKLCSEFGEELRKFIFTSNDMKKLKKNVWILVNGRNIKHLKGLDTKLYGEETITICNDLKSFRFQVLERRLIAFKVKKLIRNR